MVHIWYHIFLEKYHLAKTLEIFLDFFIIKKVSFKRFIQQYVDGLNLWITFFQKIAFSKNFLNFNKIFLAFSDIIKSFFWKNYSITFLEFLEDPDTWISFSRKISFNKTLDIFLDFTGIIKSFIWSIYSTTFLGSRHLNRVVRARKISYNKNFRTLSGFIQHYFKNF